MGRMKTEGRGRHAFGPVSYRARAISGAMPEYRKNETIGLAEAAGTLPGKGRKPC